VLDAFTKNNLRLKLSKCVFGARSVPFLGHVVSGDGLSTDAQNLDAVRSWPVPKSVKHVQSFLVLANFCRQFVPGYSHVAKSLTDLTSDKQFFEWGAAQQGAFAALKNALCSAPCLLYPDFAAPFLLYADASDYAIGGTLL